MSDFICKKCGSTEYEIKDKPNGTGIAHGLYCAKCGFWHKWLGKEELRQYEKKDSKDEIIARLQAENAALRTELEDYKIEERRAERISKYRREDARRVADKIARCCLAHCGHKVRIEAQDGFWIETCTYPPYHGKWIVEIEKCPKAEEAQKSAEARLAEMKGGKER